MSRRWALALTITGVVTPLTLATAFMGAPLADPLVSLVDRLPGPAEQIRERFRQLAWGSALLDRVSDSNHSFRMREDAVPRMPVFFSTAPGALTSTLVRLTVGCSSRPTPRTTPTPSPAWCRCAPA